MKNWYKANFLNIHDLAAIADEDTGRTVALVYDKADADLLASAPDLLAALESMVNYVMHYGTMPNANPSALKDAAQARLAIAKAKGE